MPKRRMMIDVLIKAQKFAVDNNCPELAPKIEAARQALLRDYNVFVPLDAELLPKPTLPACDDKCLACNRKQCH